MELQEIMNKLSPLWKEVSITSNSSSNASKEDKGNIRTNHECSHPDCPTYKLTSSDSDEEERIRTKATRFYKAYPKGSVSIKPIKVTSSPETPRSVAETKPLKCTQDPGGQSKIHSDVSITRKLEFVEETFKHIRDLYETKFSNANNNKRRCQESSDCIEVSSSSEDEESEANIPKSSKDPLHLKSHIHNTDNNEDSILLKGIRPFKSYPEDPLRVTIGFDTARVAVSGGRQEKYDDFRRRMLGNRYKFISDLNTNMRRFLTNNPSDNLYQEMRRKNNMASKKSRDARRVKEDEITIRCAYLEQENMFLKRKISEMERKMGKKKSQ